MAQKALTSSPALRSSFLRQFRARASSNLAYQAVNIYSPDRTLIPQTRIDEGDITTWTRSRAQTLARYLDNNYPLATAIFNQTVWYAIGDGIEVTATTPDRDFNKVLTDYFEQWSLSNFSSVSNEHNWYQSQQIIARTKKRDGEMFILLVRDTDNPTFKCQTQMIMPDQICDDPRVINPESQDGVFRDEYNRAIAYGVLTTDGWQKIDASNIIHYKGNGKGARQNRGISELVSGINDARDHQDLMKLEKQAAKTHSAIAKVVTKITGEARSGTNAGLKPNPFTANPNGQLPTRPVPANTFGMERGFGSVTHYLSPGEDVKLLTSSRGSATFQGFIEHLMKQFCLSSGLPYEFVSDPAKLNGTSMRFIIEAAATYFKNEQNEIINEVLKRVYGWVISCAIKDGFIVVPEKLKDSREVYNCTFNRPKSITVDVGRVTNAEVLLIMNRMLTFDAYYSVRGKNWEHEFRQIDAEREALIRSWIRETVLITALCKEANIAMVPTIPFPFGATAPNPTLPPPVIKASPDDTDGDTTAEMGTSESQ